MYRALSSLFIVLVLATTLNASYFSDDLSGAWEERWVQSNWKKDSGEAGDFTISAGEYYNDEKDVGLRTTTDARFYAISAAFDEFSNEGKDLILQYRVKFEQNIDCGGGYIKLLPAGIDQENFNGDTQYNIMFGPDICGSATRRVHVIFNYKGENYLIKKNIQCETDTLSHLYTLIVHPDNTYEVKIDGETKASGSLEEDWDMLPPKKIPDPNESKPEDWVDEKMIPDPEDVKPEDWDDEPMEIPDPDAVKPEEWDDELDGDWEPPMIPNPEYKGEWTPRMIPNPEYKGEWEHPLIDNPDYYEDSELYKFDSISFVGIEVWQVKAGTIFSDFLVTDSEEEANEAIERFKVLQEGERAAKEAADAERAAKAAEEAAAAEEEPEEVQQELVQEQVEEHEDL